MLKVSIMEISLSSYTWVLFRQFIQISKSFFPFSIQFQECNLNYVLILFSLAYVIMAVTFSN